MGQCLRLPWGLSFKRDRLRGRESGQSHSAKGWLLWKEEALLQLPRPWVERLQAGGQDPSELSTVTGVMAPELLQGSHKVPSLW